MAVYRQIHVSFWQDPFVLDLTPEEKYFYLYLMTNSKTKQCGCYEISKKVIEIETGYNSETVDKLLNRFIEYRKIEYCDKTKEILLKNWLKYNSSKSPKVVSCINQEIKDIKHKPFAEYIQNILYGYGIDSLSIDLGEEKEEEQEKEEEKEGKNSKTKYAEYVRMTEQQYSKLLDRYGKKPTDTMIEMLDAYKGSKGKKYKDDYRAILSWVARAYEEKHGPIKKQTNGESDSERVERERRERLERQGMA